ncbi:MAG: hypothetical protein U9Q15_03825 [Patescibacteria group bacterium]|nr:hypothetical protein [Patescibacteria group bacterium]
MNKLGAIGSAAAAIGSAALYHHINISDPNSEYISIGPVSPDTEKNIQKMDETHQSKVDDILSSVTIEYQEGNATDTMISIERKIVKQFLEQILRLFESQKIPLSYANIKQELEKDPEMMKKVQKEARELLKNLGASNDTYFYDIEEKFSDLSKEDHIRLLSILDELPVDALAYLTQQFDQDYDVHLAYAK